MTCQRRSFLKCVVPGLLAALVAPNVAFLVLLRTVGPAIGAVFYLVLLILTWGPRKREYRRVTVGGLVGLTVHAGELMMLGWTAQPTLLVLNLTLPVPLVVVAWMAGRLEEPAVGSS